MTLTRALPLLGLLCASAARAQDVRPPSLELVRPATTSVTTCARVRVVVRIRDEAPWVEVSRDGGPVRRVERGALFVDDVALPPGTTTLEWVATDAARNGSAPLRLTISRVAPIGPAEMKTAFEADPSSAGRRALVLRLDPSVDERDERGDDAVAILTSVVFTTQEWFLREAAIDALADHERDIAPELERLARSDDPALAAEGALLALARSGDARHVPLLIERLAARKWIIARGAAWALGDLPDVRGVDALIGAWEREPRWRVVLALRESLERITGRRFDDVAAWRAWRSGEGQAFGVADAPGAPREDVERIEVDGVSFDVRQRGPEGAPGVFVLPEVGIDGAAFEPFHEPLARGRRLVVVTMPVRGDLRLPADAPPTVPYPLDRVAGALEGLRQTLVARGLVSDRPVCLVAHGLAGWVAYRWVLSARDRFRRLVLISVPFWHGSWRGGEARLLEYARGCRDTELQLHAVEALTLPPVASEAGTRVWWRARFFDFRDPQIGRLIGASRPTDGLAYPQGRANPGVTLGPRPAPLGVPVLCLGGARDLLIPSADPRALADLEQSAGRAAMFPNSASLPMIEESDKYLEILERYFGRTE